MRVDQPASTAASRPLTGIIPGLGKTLDVVIAHLVPGVGMKAGNGAGVAQLVYGPGEQGDGLAGRVENALIAAGQRGVERLRQVDQQQNADVAASSVRWLTLMRDSG